MRKNVIILDAVDSTNNYLRKLAEEGAPDCQTVIAEAQTAGKGRQNHSFLSQLGGLYLSMLIRTDESALPDVMTLTAKTGVCVCMALKDAFGLIAGIKWVNDVYYHGKKICGILVEGAPFMNGCIPYLIVGIGVNLNQASFPPELSGIATSLKIEHQKEFSKSEFADALISRLFHLRENLASPSYLEDYRRLCLTVGHEVTFTKDGVVHRCRAVGIDDAFGLITEEGILRSGEVSVKM